MHSIENNSPRGTTRRVGIGTPGDLLRIYYTKLEMVNRECPHPHSLKASSRAPIYLRCSADAGARLCVSAPNQGVGAPAVIMER